MGNSIMLENLDADASIEQIRTFFERDQFAHKCLGAVVDSYDPQTGAATVSMTIDDRHHNAQGFVMGGVLFSLSDFALAVATNMGQEASSSVSSAIQFMRRAKGECLIATARPDKIGRALTFFTIDVEDELGTHVCRMTATCMRTDH